MAVFSSSLHLYELIESMIYEHFVSKTSDSLVCTVNFLFLKRRYMMVLDDIDCPIVWFWSPARRHSIVINSSVLEFPRVMEVSGKAWNILEFCQPQFKKSVTSYSNISQIYFSSWSHYALYHENKTCYENVLCVILSDARQCFKTKLSFKVRCSLLIHSNLFTSYSLNQEHCYNKVKYKHSVELNRTS